MITRSPVPAAIIYQNSKCLFHKKEKWRNKEVAIFLLNGLFFQTINGFYFKMRYRTPQIIATPRLTNKSLGNKRRSAFTFSHESTMLASGR